MMGKTDLAEDLARGGLKSTKPRMAILSILEQSRRPLNAEQVFMELKSKGTAVNLSTVYRTLEAFSDKGIAVKLDMLGDPRAFFEYNDMRHKHYLICLGCKKIQALGGCPLGDYEKVLEEETNYSISGHKLILFGYCPECRSKCENK
ncbi:MAG: transcriptional repressor [Clostridia bacterium]|nr:transcriptional repressor [Clostridia bacterium]NCC69031.1 transcriptional repressor [Clostridia bacterium]